MLPLLIVALWMQAIDPAAAGMKALEAQHFDEAVQLFAEASKKAPEDLSARFYYGLSLSLVNRDDEAIAAYKQVLEMQPGLYEAQLNLGGVHLRQKQLPEALALVAAAQKAKAVAHRA